MAWLEHLVRLEGDFVRVLTVSSTLVAVFCALVLDRKLVLASGIRVVMVQVIFIFMGWDGRVLLHLILIAVIALPVLAFWRVLSGNFRRVGDEESRPD